MRLIVMPVQLPLFEASWTSIATIELYLVSVVGARTSSSLNLGSVGKASWKPRDPLRNRGPPHLQMEVCFVLSRPSDIRL